MDLLTGFTIYIEKEQLFTHNQSMLLAVSGGVDSVVMAHLFKAAGFTFSIAHCNFQLRGEESLRDEAFVEDLAARLQVPFYKVRFDTMAHTASHRVSIQVAARQLRYEWLEQTMVKTGCDYIVTAHHMQDSAETVLMNLSKGTGIAGLHGILPKQGYLVRPLLFAQKADIQAYASERHIAFVEDSSNITVKYTRNFFRHKVIPVIQEAYPGVVANIAGSIERFREAEILYAQSVEKHIKRLVEQKGNMYMIPVLKLRKTIPMQTVAWEIFRQYGCSPAQLSQVLELLDSSSGKLVETSTHRIIRDRQWLLITPLAEEEVPVIVIEKDRTAVAMAGGLLKLRTSVRKDAISIPTAANIACLDRHSLQYPLILRKWKQGDYFYPLGMRKKKKLSRFFIDQKLSLPQKENTWVLESAKRVVWIVGLRIDDRFKITDQTKELLTIEWETL
ncbi:tRNA lysidine(34) synthetase TilS [Chitinophaga filiformis]|uniref:tRNA lysidine(34) synthetase TilS n=1 Tax=Chitinophaga filiformis TaxID=104663 RepID=UPI001F2C5762|nr:tRNA lysidine(34) synthetase TilS [Chitinophaga filiformis]MCF6406021.1 tRNA lysidine(34) synthetase TilS [Chitinophaga filiformis]